MSKLGTEEAEQIYRRRGGYFTGRVYFSADKMSQATRFRTSEGVADSRYNQ